MIVRLAKRATYAACLLLAVVLVTSAASKGTQAASDKDRAELILSALPATDSPDYKTLRDLAGDVHGQSLQMTRSEVWSVPRTNLEPLKKPLLPRE
jgi:hypothetical protein